MLLCYLCKIKRPNICYKQSRDKQSFMNSERVWIFLQFNKNQRDANSNMLARFILKRLLNIALALENACEFSMAVFFAKAAIVAAKDAKV